MKFKSFAGVRALTFVVALGLSAAMSVAQETSDTLDSQGVVPSGAEAATAVRKPKPVMPAPDAGITAPAASETATDKPAPAATAAKAAPKAAAKVAPATPAASAAVKKPAAPASANASTTAKAAVAKPAGTPAPPATAKKTVAAPSPCKGLDQTACGTNKACGWIVPKDPNAATGKVQDPYCRASQQSVQKKPAVKKVNAAKAAPAAPAAAATATAAPAVAATTAAVPAVPQRSRKWWSTHPPRQPRLQPAQLMLRKQLRPRRKPQ